MIFSGGSAQEDDRDYQLQTADGCPVVWYKDALGQMVSLPRGQHPAVHLYRAKFVGQDIHMELQKAAPQGGAEWNLAPVESFVLVPDDVMHAHVFAAMNAVINLEFSAQ